MFDKYDYSVAGIGGAIFILILFLFFIVGEEEKKNKQYMAECMKDHKEYECVAMLKNNYKYYPVVIPMHIGR